MQPERRTDALTADEINRAVELDRTQGAIAAWIYLMRRGVSTNTIQRVLMIAGGSLPDPPPYPINAYAHRRRG